MELNNKAVIITGASSGIGAAAAIRFAKAGARLVLGARRKAELDDTAQQVLRLGGEVLAVPGDVSDPGYADALAEAAERRFGRLDIAFNNAGILGPMATLEQLSDADWSSVVTTNLTAAFRAAKAQVPLMRKGGGGSLIFTSSFVGSTIGFPGMTAYAASKSGLRGLVQSLAVELGPENIRVNALMPGGTLTPMAGDFSDNPEGKSTVAGFHALKRMAEPDEIAAAALFLASDAASFVTGTEFFVDGGNSITKV